MKREDLPDPYKKRVKERREARERARKEIGVFVLRSRFTALVSQGTSPMKAANILGLKMPIGERFTSLQIIKKIEKGEL